MSQLQLSSSQAVAGPGLLFSLPPEVRTMIYCLLLTHEERIPIAISHRDFPRRSERIRALKKIEDVEKPKTLRVKPPSLFPSILRVSRLIYLEACPLLYSLNTFKFDRPSALGAFRWRSDPKMAAAVREIVIDVDRLNFNEWKTFIVDRKELTTTKDWPCLRRAEVIIDIIYKTTHIYEMW